MAVSWLQVTLIVEPELAEAVSEVLARYIPGGIVIESTAVVANAEDEGHPVGPLRVRGYIPVDDQLEATKANIEQGLRYLAMIQPVPEPQYETVQDQNWMEAWKQHYKPLQIGQRLLIVPAWMEAQSDDRIPIRIEPGMAFGTGVHPTTQLSLMLVETYVKPGASVIDVGCGSAILSIAAAKLGAGPIVAVDIDTQAMENAKHNVRLNQADIEIGIGSVTELLNRQFALQQANVVTANILAPVLIRLLEDGMVKLLKPAGMLLLSGILAEQEQPMRSALANAKLRIVEERRIGDWLGLAARRE